MREQNERASLRCDYIGSGALTAHIFLYGGCKRRRLDEGHYRLVPASAGTLVGWTDHLVAQRNMESVLVGEPHPVRIVTREPDIRVTLPGAAAASAEIRVLREEAERFEKDVLNKEQGRQEHGNLRDEQRHRERCRAIAQLLWELEPELTIEDMKDRREITLIGQEEKPYNSTTVRNWIKDLCPNRAPGRRPKNSRQQGE